MKHQHKIYKKINKFLALFLVMCMVFNPTIAYADGSEPVSVSQSEGDVSTSNENGTNDTVENTDNTTSGEVDDLTNENQTEPNDNNLVNTQKNKPTTNIASPSSVDGDNGDSSENEDEVDNNVYEDEPEDDTELLGGEANSDNNINNTSDELLNDSISDHVFDNIDGNINTASPSDVYEDFSSTDIDESEEEIESNLATTSNANEMEEEIDEEEHIASPSNMRLMAPRMLGAPTVLGITPPKTLCFTANTAGSTIKLNDGSMIGVNLQYSNNDGNTWTTWNTGVKLTLSNIGDKIYVKGNNSDFSSTDDWFVGFEMTGSIAASGNIMGLIDDGACTTTSIPKPYFFRRLFENCSSLTSAPSLPATGLDASCYALMFKGCTGLTSLPDLPATSLVQGCYINMFEGCTGITIVPGDYLPATNLANDCYQSMFSGCEALTTAPALPATTLATECYKLMFNGCKTLTTAPALPATTLQYNCYQSMFFGCIALTTPPVLPATTLADGCYDSMFYGCSNLVLKHKQYPSNGIMREWKISASNDPLFWSKEMFTNCDKVDLNGSMGKECLANTTYYTIGGSPSPTPSGGGSSGGGGGGGTIDPSGKPLDPQIVSPGINTVPNVDIPKETKVPINYDDSTKKKVVVSNAPYVDHDSNGNSKLNLTGMDGVTYIADFGFYDVVINNIAINTNENVDTYYVNEASYMISGWIETANKKRYFMENTRNQNEGKMCHGWKKIQNDWYYFDYDGAMMRGRKTYDGYMVDGEGKMTNPSYLDQALINGVQKKVVYSMESHYEHR